MKAGYMVISEKLMNEFINFASNKLAGITPDGALIAVVRKKSYLITIV